MFHDETARVKNKVRAKQSNSCKAPKRPPVACHTESVREAPSSRQSHTDQAAPCPPTLILRSHIQPSLEDLSLGYFFSKYVFKYKDYRDSWNVDDGNGCLLLSIKALGVAGVTKCGSITLSSNSEAQRYYLDAIEGLNSALWSPEYVKRDSTLQAINILGIFESVNGLNKSLDAWRNHINGAASLLQLRGPEQFRTQTGCRLFLQTCSSLVISCLTLNIPIPDHVRTVRAEAEKHVIHPRDPVWRFLCTSMAVADLNSRMKSRNILLSVEEARSVIARAEHLFRELKSILDHSPPDWKPQVVSGTGATIYSDYYYVFSSYIIAQVFAGICSYRLYLLNIIWRASKSLNTEHDLSKDQQQRVHDAFSSKRELQLSILATVPQHLGDASQPIHSNTLATDFANGDGLWTKFSSRDHNPFRSVWRPSKDIPFVRMAGGYLIQMPLYSAGAADAPNGPIRRFVIDTLRLLGRSMGLAQAFVLASMLEGSPG